MLSPSVLYIISVLNMNHLRSNLIVTICHLSTDLGLVFIVKFFQRTPLMPSHPVHASVYNRIRYLVYIATNVDEGHHRVDAKQESKGIKTAF